jgi:hypothetical protein
MSIRSALIPFLLSVRNCMNVYLVPDEVYRHRQRRYYYHRPEACCWVLTRRLK